MTCIICPQSYSSIDSNDYDKKITYETIREFFNGHSTERCKYISSIFNDALIQRSSVLPPNLEIFEFRRKVWELALKDYSHIALKEPMPGREYWVCQSYGDITLKYKMLSNRGVFRECFVDLELPGYAEKIDWLHKMLTSTAKDINASIVQTGKSASLRIVVPVIEPPKYDESGVRAALEAWSALLKWWQDHRTAINFSGSNPYH